MPQSGTLFDQSKQLEKLVQEVAVLEFRRMFKKANSAFSARFQTYLTNTQRLQSDKDIHRQLSEKIKQQLAHDEHLIQAPIESQATSAFAAQLALQQLAHLQIN